MNEKRHEWGEKGGIRLDKDVLSAPSMRAASLTSTTRRDALRESEKGRVKRGRKGLRVSYVAPQRRGDPEKIPPSHSSVPVGQFHQKDRIQETLERLSEKKEEYETLGREKKGRRSEGREIIPANDNQEEYCSSSEKSTITRAIRKKFLSQHPVDGSMSSLVNT